MIVSITIQDLAARIGITDTGVFVDLKKKGFVTHRVQSSHTGQWLPALSREDAERYLATRRQRRNHGSDQAGME